MLEVEKDKVFRISEKCILHKLGDELYWLFDIEGGDIFELNATSHFIISCFDGKTTLQNIQDRVTSRYGDVEAQEVYSTTTPLIIFLY